MSNETVPKVDPNQVRVEKNMQKFEIRKKEKEKNGPKVHVNKYPKTNG